MRLRDQPWWPVHWNCYGSVFPGAAEVSREGVFKSSQLAPPGLTLAVDYNGRLYTATIPPQAVQDARPDDPSFLSWLSKYLERYQDKPFYELEDIDIL